MTIPPVLHRVLVGDYDPGAESERWWDRFGELNPGWERRTWRDPIDPGGYELGRLFSSCRTPTQLADLLRIEILWREGGVYVDTDVEPLRPFDRLVDVGLFIGTEDGDRISSGVIGAEPGHPALRVLIDRLLEYQEIPASASPAQSTGPMLYTRCFADRDDVVVLPREVFYPYNPYIGIGRDSGWSSRHTVCVHHWAGGGRPSKSSHDARKQRTTPRPTVRRVVRDRVLPPLRRLAGHLVDPPMYMHGTYSGAGQMLVSTLDGFLLHVPADNSVESAALVSRGWHDDAVLAFMDRHLRGGDWCLELGAGAGALSLAAARRVGRCGKVLACEPRDELAELCAANVALNEARWIKLVTDGELLDAIPRCAPIRLARLDARATQLLPLLADVANQRAIDFAVVDATRRGAGEHWSQLLETLRLLVDAGAKVGVLSRSGATRPVGLDEVSVQESLTPLVVSL